MTIWLLWIVALLACSFISGSLKTVLKIESTSELGGVYLMLYGIIDSVLSFLVIYLFISALNGHFH